MRRNFRKSIVLFSAVLFLSFSYAETPSFEKVCNMLAVNKITKGNFTQIKTMKSAKGQRELTSNGDYIFSLEGIMWKTLKPFPSTMIIGESSIIQISKDGSKKVTDTSDNKVFASVAETLIAVFSNDYSQLIKLFKVDYSTKNNSEWEAVLTPKDSTIASVMSFLKLSGTYSASGAALTGIVMTESSGNTTSYIFENNTYPGELTKDEKAFFSSK